MSKDELWQLREEITLNSVFLNDYENSKDIDVNRMYEFFNGYLDYLSELMAIDNIDNNHFFDKLSKYDNKKNLFNYYESIETTF